MASIYVYYVHVSILLGGGRVAYNSYCSFQINTFLTKIKRTCYLLADHEKKTAKEIGAPNKKVS